MRGSAKNPAQMTGLRCRATKTASYWFCGGKTDGTDHAGQTPRNRHTEWGATGAGGRASNQRVTKDTDCPCGGKLNHPAPHAMCRMSCRLKVERKNFTTIRRIHGRLDCRLDKHRFLDCSPGYQLGKNR